MDKKLSCVRLTPRGSAAGDAPAPSEFYDPPRAGTPARTGARLCERPSAATAC